MTDKEKLREIRNKYIQSLKDIIRLAELLEKIQEFAESKRIRNLDLIAEQQKLHQKNILGEHYYNSYYEGVYSSQIGMAEDILAIIKEG